MEQTVPVLEHYEAQVGPPTLTFKTKTLTFNPYFLSLSKPLHSCLFQIILMLKSVVLTVIGHI